eukprot:150334-Prymnesium_polylepis.1
MLRNGSYVADAFAAVGKQLHCTEVGFDQIYTTSNTIIFAFQQLPLVPSQLGVFIKGMTSAHACLE